MISWIADRLLAVAGFVTSWLIAVDSPNFVLAEMATALFLLLLILLFLAFGRKLSEIFVSVIPFMPNRFSGCQGLFPTCRGAYHPPFIYAVRS